MGIVRNLMVRAGADFTPLESAMKKSSAELSQFKRNVTGSLNNVSNAVNKSRTGISGAVAGIAGVFGIVGLAVGAAMASVVETIKTATEQAIALDTSMQQVNFILKNSGDSFQQWSQTVAASFGYSQQAAENAGAVYSNIIAGFTQNTEENKARTEDLMRATAIISARTGRSMEDVIERIRSGLLGNTEAIEDLGIYAQVSMMQSTDAFKKFANGKSWNQLNYQTKQQILLMGILEQATKKYGNSLPDNIVTRINKFHAAWRNLVTNFGNVFVPILYRIIPPITKVINILATGMSYIAAFYKGLYGMTDAKETDSQTASINKQTGAANSLSNAIKNVGKAKKDASGGLAGFDEIHNLNNGSAGDSGVGSGGIGGIGDVGTKAEEISNKIANFVKKFKLAGQAVGELFKGIKDIAKGNFNKGIHELADGFGDLVQLFIGVDIHKGLNDIASGLNDLVHGNFKKGISEIRQGLSEIIEVIFGKNGRSINKGINDFNKGLKDIVHGNFKQGLSEIGKGFKEVWTSMTKVFEPVSNWFSDHVTKPISNVFVNWKDDIANKAGDIWNAIKSKFSDAYSWFSNNVGKQPYKAFSNWKDSIAQEARDVWTSIKAKFGDAYSWFRDHLAKEPLNAFSNWKSSIANEAGNVWNAIKGKFGDAYGWFKKNVADKISNAFSGITHSFSSSLTSGFKYVYNRAVGYINDIIKAINKMVRNLNGLWGVSGIPYVPTIPKLANGGYIGADSPVLAMVGDNKHEGEIIAPESKIYEQTYKAIKDALGESGGNAGGTQELVVNIGGTTVFRKLIDGINKTQREAGKTLIEV